MEVEHGMLFCVSHQRWREPVDTEQTHENTQGRRENESKTIQWTQTTCSLFQGSPGARQNLGHHSNRLREAGARNPAKHRG